MRTKAKDVGRESRDKIRKEVAVTQNAVVAEITYEHEKMGDREVSALAYRLKGNRVTWQLKLQDNRITDRSVKAICDIVSNPSVRGRLTISNNELTAKIKEVTTIMTKSMQGQ